MHFVTGGAFNGKRAWVKEAYRDHADGVHWISAYNQDPLPRVLGEINHNIVIFEGAEAWLKELVREFTAAHCRDIWKRCLDNWLTWENEKRNRKVVVIGTDITKGIVPIEAVDRAWRDVTGWAYQDTASKAKNVDVIWYGLNQTIK